MYFYDSSHISIWFIIPPCYLGQQRERGTAIDPVFHQRIHFNFGEKSGHNWLCWLLGGVCVGLEYLTGPLLVAVFGQGPRSRNAIKWISLFVQSVMGQVMSSESLAMEQNCMSPEEAAEEGHVSGAHPRTETHKGGPCPGPLRPKSCLMPPQVPFNLL